MEIAQFSFVTCGMSPISEDWISSNGKNRIINFCVLMHFSIRYIFCTQNVLPGFRAKLIKAFIECVKYIAK